MANSLNISTGTRIRTLWDCKRCGSFDVTHTQPKPNTDGRITNAGGIYCADCSRFGRWLSPGQAQTLGLKIERGLS
jgi:hypothetical protein